MPITTSRIRYSILSWRAPTTGRSSPAGRSRRATRELIGRYPATGKNPAEREKRDPHNRWKLSILGAYESRWAPCIQTHEPGQGQLPKDRVWPRGFIVPVEKHRPRK